MRAFAVLLAVAFCMSGEAARIKKMSLETLQNTQASEASPSALLEAQDSNMNVEGEHGTMEAEDSDMNEEEEDDPIEAEEDEQSKEDDTTEDEEDDTIDAEDEAPGPELVNPEGKVSLNSFENIISKRGPLVPELVNSEAKIYKVKENMQFGNNYNVYDKTSGKEKDVKVIRIRGKWSSKYFGRGVSHAHDPKTGERIFKIKRSRHAWNPVEWVGRYSYRILAPHEKDTKKALYTINKDYFGRGFLWTKEEWRIYRGTKRNGELAYYCVGSYLGWDTKCYESKEDYNQGRKGLTVWGPSEIQEMKRQEPVAELGQKWWNLATTVGLPFNLLPDAYYVKVKPGADTALFIAFATILDTTHDINGKGNIVGVGLTLDPVTGAITGAAAPGQAAYALPAKAVEKVSR
jgi:hypothetical protein